jgi:hypothetical protein
MDSDGGCEGVHVKGVAGHLSVHHDPSPRPCSLSCTWCTSAGPSRGGPPDHGDLSKVDFQHWQHLKLKLDKSGAAPASGSSPPPGGPGHIKRWSPFVGTIRPREGRKAVQDSTWPKIPKWSSLVREAGGRGDHLPDPEGGLGLRQAPQARQQRRQDIRLQCLRGPARLRCPEPLSEIVHHLLAVLQCCSWEDLAKHDDDGDP